NKPAGRFIQISSRIRTKASFSYAHSPIRTVLRVGASGRLSGSSLIPERTFFLPHADDGAPCVKGVWPWRTSCHLRSRLFSDPQCTHQFRDALREHDGMSSDPYRPSTSGHTKSALRPLHGLRAQSVTA